MSIEIIDEICFCSHTLDFFFNLIESNKKNFLFIYPFESVYCRINRTALTCCGNCQKLIAKNRNCQVSCFQRYFPKKGRYLDLKEAHL